MMRMTSVDRDRILDEGSGEVNKKTVLLNVRRNSETSTGKRNGTNIATANARFGKEIPEPFPFPGSPGSLRSARNPAPRSMSIPTIGARTLFQTFPHTPFTGTFEPSHTCLNPCVASSHRSATPLLTGASLSSVSALRTGRSLWSFAGGEPKQGAGAPWTPAPASDVHDRLLGITGLTGLHSRVARRSA